MTLNDCIFSTLKPGNQGYVLKFYEGRYQGLHRISWSILNGPIPKGMHIDHSCHNEALANGTCQGGKSCKHRACVNPAHLRLISHLENVQAGGRPLGNNTHCVNGHLVADNLAHRPSGKAYCLTCRKESSVTAMARAKVGK
jgi:hypothetical protein